MHPYLLKPLGLVRVPAFVVPLIGTFQARRSLGHKSGEWTQVSAAPCTLLQRVRLGHAVQCIDGESMALDVSILWTTRCLRRWSVL